MAVPAVSDELLLAELYRRRQARSSLIEFARSIEIPGVPPSEYDEDSEQAYLDEVVFAPIESVIVLHHRVMLAAIQRCLERRNGRLMILAPPGSAKSTYASVVTPPWAMGRWPGYRMILLSYATKLARKQSRRAQQIIRQPEYGSIWPERPGFPSRTAGAEEWSLTNASELMAAGILAGVTGNRADAVICDDLIAGREEAESPTIREKTMEAFRDDAESRLLPGGSIVLINTRWHQEDPSGQILPEDYDGQSGMVLCQDGVEWEVLNIPAKAERADDPLGRAVGEYLWPEWFPVSHWQAIENNPLGRRRWASLYQQRPTADEGEDFERAWFHWYEPGELPKQLTIYGASDFAVTEVEPEAQRQGRIDWTEHGVVGMDSVGDLWFLDWWSGQTATDTSIDAMLDLAEQYRPVRWWDEGGVIDKAIRPAVRRRMRERRRYVTLDALPRIADKRAKCQSFQARAAARTVHLPAGKPWAHDVVSQLTGFPGHRYDDKYDVCGLIGRGVEKMMDAREPASDRRRGIKPFTEEWLMHNDQAERKKPRDR